MTVIGRVTALNRYPVKSMQGLAVDRLDVGPDRITGDREWALIDDRSGTLLSAKRVGRLLEAVTSESDGTVCVSVPGTPEAIAVDDPSLGPALTSWLGRPVTVRRAEADTSVEYEMTFDPPDDEAEYYRIPAPAGSFLDLAAVHLVSEATLGAAADARPDLNWDTRRFRPNIVVDADVAPFGEDGWCGQEIRVGGAVLSAQQPTVRCAMPLRAQPGLDREPDLYRALEALHANHLGIYLAVVDPGPIALGDPVEIVQQHAETDGHDTRE